MESATAEIEGTINCNHLEWLQHNRSPFEAETEGTISGNRGHNLSGSWASA